MVSLSSLKLFGIKILDSLGLAEHQERTKAKKFDLHTCFSPDVCVRLSWRFLVMPSLIEPGDVQLGVHLGIHTGDQLDVLTCGLKCGLEVLEEETLKQVWTSLTMVKTNRAQYDGLANVYQAGVEKIATLVGMVLQLREYPSTNVELIEEADSLTRLLLSLAEIERCMQSGVFYILSCAELLDSDVGDISVSKMISSLVREFSFSLDLVQVAFSFLMCKHRRHQLKGFQSADELKSFQSADEWRDLAAAMLVYCRPSDCFEWCERLRRPVLKQSFLDLGQEVWQFSALVGEAAYKDQGHVGHPGNNCEPDLSSGLEELAVQPRDSLPLRIDHQDVQDREYLGQGSFGTVFRCKWQDKDRVVKIIQLDPEHLECERAFEREVSILASLRHPNAVQTFGFGYTEGRAQGFYVMEQMQTDLSTIIRESRRLSGESLVFPIDVSMDIISQIVEGMCALRLQRVIHRDLKPANILVNRPDESTKPFERFYRVKLADFGTSKFRDGDLSIFSTLRVGTPAYMAPEVMAATLLPEGAGEHGYSWKADVYSLGLVCSEILTGVVPFRKYIGHIGNTLVAVRGGERPGLPLAAGDPLRSLIEDCWKLNSAERPDVREVCQRLWECRLFHFFMMKKPSTSWQTFCFRLDSRRANINGIETSSGFDSSSPISGSKEREQAPALLNCSRGALQVTELMQNVISIARSNGGCNPSCTELANELSSSREHIESLMEKLTESKNKRLCLADVERLRRCVTALGGSLRAVAGSLCETGVGVHHCKRISIATWRLLGLFSSEALYDIRELFVSLQGPPVLSTRERISAAMDRIQFDPGAVHIAVCGTSGSGISSFINSLCGLGDGGVGAAPVGVTQCTSKICRYPNVIDTSPLLMGPVWFCDVPGAGTMASPEGQYFNDQGLFIFDAIVLVYDVRFSRIDAEIIKTSLRFNVPVFVVRSKADQHIANMIKLKACVEFGDKVSFKKIFANMIWVKLGVQPSDKRSFEKVYHEMADTYVEATRSEFKGLKAAMAGDPEMDLRDQELLLKQRVYIWSNKPGSEDLGKYSLNCDLQTFLSTKLSTMRLVSVCDGAFKKSLSSKQRRMRDREDSTESLHGRKISDKIVLRGPSRRSFQSSEVAQELRTGTYGTRYEGKKGRRSRFHEYQNSTFKNVIE